MADYSITRSITVNAPASVIHPHINDFRQWIDWSPWENLDPDMQRSYDGPESGVGARYGWTGDRKAGAGTMTILASSPEEIQIALEFTKPFKASNTITFTLAPVPAGTCVIWRMDGVRGPLAGTFMKLMKMDDQIAADFDRGLASLKAVAES